MSLTTRLTKSRDAWGLLRGIACVYKPSEYLQGRLMVMLRHRLMEELNSMERVVERDDGMLQLDGGSRDIVAGGNTVGGDMVAGQSVDYSVHPLVLGPGYTPEDIQILPVNKLAEDVSGVVVVGVNSGLHQAKKLQSAKLLNTFEVRGEWGRATSTGWATGKTRYCHTWKHLIGRPWLVDQCLASVQASHQARAWNVSNCALDTQEAYEQALNGPVKPTLLSETLVYNIKVREWKLPHFMLEVQCVEGMDDKQKYLVRLIEELGLKVKSCASVTSIRCAAVGPFTSSEGLLPKHFTLQHMLNNMSDNKKMLREINTKADHGFRRKEKRVKSDSGTKEGEIQNHFSSFLEE